MSVSHKLLTMISVTDIQDSSFGSLNGKLAKTFLERRDVDSSARATGSNTIGITQCYLPPDTSKHNPP